jgi:hypothetical protein
MSDATCGDRRPVSQLHSADDVPELMRRAMRSFARAEELAKDLARVSDAERDALRSGFLGLARRYVVQLRDEGETPCRVAVRLREELDDALMPFSVRHHCGTLVDEAEQCIAEVFSSMLAHSARVLK